MQITVSCYCHSLQSDGSITYGDSPFVRHACLWVTLFCPNVAHGPSASKKYNLEVNLYIPPIPNACIFASYIQHADHYGHIIIIKKPKSQTT